MHQVVTNLLANARTHTPAGTRVTTSLSASGGFAEVRVSDNGPGVPAEIRDSVFERFTRADVSRVRQAGGSSTGLGLALVTAVIHAHGGDVRLESEWYPFTVRVPLADRAPPQRSLSHGCHAAEPTFVAESLRFGRGPYARTGR